MLDMVTASLLKIWHLIPIIIFIILFKKYVNNKDKKRRIDKNDENEKKGLTLKSRAQIKYEKLGYEVKEDEEINLICYRDDKILLLQCENSSNAKSIKAEDIKIFYNNAIEYVKKNEIEEKDVEFRYIIAYSDVLDKSAIKILMDKSYNCKYVVL